MAVFRRHRLQEYERLLEACNAALGASASAAWDSAALASDFLTETARTYAVLGQVVDVNETLTLRAELAAAMRGVRLRVDAGTHGGGGRRRFAQAVALRTLVEAGERLRKHARHEAEQLSVLGGQLAELLIAASVAGAIPAAADSPQDVWRALADHAVTREAVRRLAMTASIPDILVIVGDQLNIPTAESRSPGAGEGT
ncbi:hypothetical protein [Jiangella muralis]|uniref:hypothetical protein n=1 Tax=Jiangella muralis TaxID=702383 RepID=UPI0009FA4676|nr:hypothetical protein [Jiangella muralis]